MSRTNNRHHTGVTGEDLAPPRDDEFADPNVTPDAKVTMVFDCPGCERDGHTRGHTDPETGKVRVGHGCRGCARDGHTGNHRVSGRLQPGHTANAAGRRHGRPNNTTLAAIELRRENALPAIRCLVRQLDSKNEWIAAHAAKELSRDLPKDGESEPVDTTWLMYATKREFKTIVRIMQLCQARSGVINVDANGEPFTAEELDTDAWDVTPPEPASDAFDTASMPAPQDGPVGQG